MKRTLTSGVLVLTAAGMLSVLAVSGSEAAKLITGKQIARDAITAKHLAKNSVGTQELQASARSALQGPRGAVGARGPAGVAGPQGAAGADGADGAVGPQGATGAVGPQGATGSAGPQGATGSAGAKGATGSAGATGATGATGSAGADGAPGATGAPGSQGAQGEQGPQGAPGTPGAPGADGANGTDGVANGYIRNRTYYVQPGKTATIVVACDKTDTPTVTYGKYAIAGGISLPGDGPGNAHTTTYDARGDVQVRVWDTPPEITLLSSGPEYPLVSVSGRNTTTKWQATVRNEGAEEAEVLVWASCADIR